jgi:addiction module RelB/DinJ family antitoxin
MRQHLVILNEVAIMMDSMIRCRIDKQTLEAVTPVLERMGLNVSSAIRLFLKRIEQAGEFPFDLAQQNSAQSQVAGIAAALQYLRFQEQQQSSGIASLHSSAKHSALSDASIASSNALNQQPKSAPEKS